MKLLVLDLIITLFASFNIATSLDGLDNWMNILRLTLSVFLIILTVIFRTAEKIKRAKEDDGKISNEEWIDIIKEILIVPQIIAEAKEKKEEPEPEGDLGVMDPQPNQIIAEAKKGKDEEESHD